MNIPSHRRWMYERREDLSGRIKVEFYEGVEVFINHCKGLRYYRRGGKIRCPCESCILKGHLLEEDEVRDHLYRYGFKQNYWYWTEHNEVAPPDYFPVAYNAYGASSSGGNVDAVEQFGNYSEMVTDATPQQYGELFGGYPSERAELHHDYVDDINDYPYEVNERVEPPNESAQKFYDILEEFNIPSWSGCEHFQMKDSSLSLGTRLMSAKSDWNLPRDAMDEVMNIISDNVPPDADIPRNFYDLKKQVSMLGLVSKKIYCCMNGCMLYYQEDCELEKCKFCDTPRYRRRRSGEKPIPLKRMHYLPIIPRLQRLYASMSSAPYMTWHHQNRRGDDVMCHPSHGKAWQEFDRLHPHFAFDPRNIRLGLCTDGFNPYSQSASPYSCWPVIVTPYNLPPEMCMTSPYMFLTCITPGPKNPKQCIDIYLQPLIEELRTLWEYGVPTYDVSKKQNFLMRAALMWTVSDFPAYGMLSGWMTAGRLACPYCMGFSKSFRLKHGGKTSWFDYHRQFLENDHPYRSNVANFIKRRREYEGPPPRMCSNDVWDMVNGFPKVHAEGGTLPVIEGYGKEHNWTRQSILWELSYWKDQLICHNLDVMHIEKNFFDNVFNTVMDVNGKSKDNVKARQDLPQHCRRPDLELIDRGNGRLLKPKAKYVFNGDQRRTIIQWVKELRMPDGYSSNSSRRIYGLNFLSEERNIDPNVGSSGAWERLFQDMQSTVSRLDAEFRSHVTVQVAEQVGELRQHLSQEVNSLRNEIAEDREDIVNLRQVFTRSMERFDRTWECFDDNQRQFQAAQAGIAAAVFDLRTQMQSQNSQQRPLVQQSPPQQQRPPPLQQRHSPPLQQRQHRPSPPQRQSSPFVTTRSSQVYIPTFEEVIHSVEEMGSKLADETLDDQNDEEPH